MLLTSVKNFVILQQRAQHHDTKMELSSLSSEEQRLGAELARRFANCAPVSDLLVQRGITTIDAAEKFFHPSLRDLHDPFLMPRWTSPSSV